MLDQEELRKVKEFRLRLNRIDLHNFRRFADIIVQFHPELTVFIGENGAGKTTILEATAKTLELFTWRATHPTDISGDDLRRIFQDSDLRNGTKDFSNHIYLDLEFEHLILASDEESQEEEGEKLQVERKEDVKTDLDWSVGFAKKGHQIQVFNKREQLIRFVDTVNYRLQQDLPINLPVIAYFPVKAMPVDWNIGNGMERHFDFDIFEAYHDALNGRAFDFRVFFEWFKWQENREKQDGINSTLDSIRSAVYTVLNDKSSDRLVFDRLHIDWRTAVGEMVIYKNEERLSVNQFSSGEKAMVSLVAGIALRLILANPYREKPLEGNGIVLIDEIDLHLHPSWQRMVIPKLREIFPNVQFIMTTHSPLVLQGVQRENIRVLIDGKISEEVPFVYGRDPNSITEDAFGVALRPHDVEKMVEEISRLIDEENEGAAKEKLNELKKLWGDDDREIQRLALHTELM